MEASNIVSLFFAVLFLNILVEVILEVLNVRYSRAASQDLPAMLRAEIDKVTQEQSVLYSGAKSRFAIASSLFSAMLLVVVIWKGWLGTLDGVVGEYLPPGIGRSVIFMVSLLAALSLTSLPFGLYRSFVIEARFGFNRLTVQTWLLDRIKGIVLGGAILVPLLFGLFWFMERAGELWWVYASLLVGGVQLLLVFLLPTVIAPLFNKFSSLPAGELRERLERLGSQLSFQTSGIFIMDGSKRSAHANAFFAGMGGNKRVVLFDTLVDLLSPHQIEAVLAHEIGHEKHHHLVKGLLRSLVGTLLVFAVTGVLASSPGLYRAFGFSEASSHALIAILTLGSSPFLFFLSPLFSSTSRQYEYEADRFAVDAMKGWRPLAEGLLALSRKSLSNLAPHPLYSFFHYSHPTLVERMTAMERYAHSQGYSG